MGAEMKDTELECIPSWRYCQVREGEKIPYPAGWQNTPKRIRDIDSTNVGLLLGTPSHGIVALDFDGTSAWTWFEQRIGCTLPRTVTWTSGKTDRCQMAFLVPEEAWDHIKTQKITHTRDNLIAEGEGFEFRWTGCQSVMPPSSLTDGREYEWIRSPCETQTAELPIEILRYWLSTGENTKVLNTNPVVDITVDDVDETKFTELAKILEQIHKQTPNPDYDDWMRIAFAAASEVGNSVAAALLAAYWPEKVRGEYSRLLSSRDPSRSPTIKSLVYRINNTHQREHNEKYLAYLQQQKEIKELERLIKEKKNEQSKH